jgi:hypothetical protein
MMLEWNDYQEQLLKRIGDLGRSSPAINPAQSGTLGVGPLVSAGYFGDRNAFPT